MTNVTLSDNGKKVPETNNEFKKKLRNLSNLYLICKMIDNSSK